MSRSLYILNKTFLSNKIVLDQMEIIANKLNLNFHKINDPMSTSMYQMAIQQKFMY
jgi:hypothetical protein